MITLYELKNKSFCRCFIRTPFYIKNLFLLIIMSLVLSLIYIIYFSREGGGSLRIQSISKLLKGLNSDTFNYLAMHSDPLKYTKLLNNYQIEITSNQFMDDCLKISKPCKFEGLAMSWPGYDKWKYNLPLSEEDSIPYSVLEEQIGSGKLVEVYVDLDPDATFDSTPLSSFKTSTLTKMRYKEFLD